MEQIELDFEVAPFRPKFLHELVDFAYSEWAPELRQHELKQLLDDAHGKGHLWEQVLKRAMKHTSLLGKNAPYRDFDDNSDAKFAFLGTYNNSTQRQATISSVNKKIGPLRVCLCVRGMNVHKVYFMYIPYEAFKDMKGENLKVTFKNFMPSGPLWDKYQCTWEDVIKPV